MRAVVVEKPGEIAVTTGDGPAPDPRQVVIAVDGCGICDTDIHLIDGEIAVPAVPDHPRARVRR